MSESRMKQPEVIVFAGPNGSGKTTITKLAKTVDPYINADEIKMTVHCSDIEAAMLAERMRNEQISGHHDFTFETVMSTRRNLDLLIRAKSEGYFIRCIYVLTADVEVNVSRVMSRERNGGHGVPEDKIRSRYEKAISLIPELVEVCDVMHIYDNTDTPFRIFKKRKDVFFYWENSDWTKERIEELTGTAS